MKTLFYHLLSSIFECNYDEKISVRFSLSNLPSKSANFFNQHLVIYIRLPHVAVQSFITNLSTIADYRQSIDFISLRLSKFAILLTK